MAESYMDKPLKMTDHWCAHAQCPNIGKPEENGKSICDKCKREAMGK